MKFSTNDLWAKFESLQIAFASLIWNIFQFFKAHLILKVLFQLKSLFL